MAVVTLSDSLCLIHETLCQPPAALLSVGQSPDTPVLLTACPVGRTLLKAFSGKGPMMGSGAKPGMTMTAVSGMQQDGECITEQGRVHHGPIL